MTMQATGTSTGKKALLGVKILFLTIALMIISGIGSGFIPATPEVAPDAGETAPSAAFLGTVITLMFLQTVALAYPVLRARWSGWKLTVAVFVLYFGAGTALSQFETFIYLGHRLSSEMQLGIWAMGLFCAIVFSPLLVLVLGKWRKTKPGHSPYETATVRPYSLAWKLAAGALVFVGLYYLFGYYVAWQNPELRAYYGGTDPGSFIAQMAGIVETTPWMLPLQFIRGLLWMLLAYLAVRMMKGPWWEAGLALSLVFTVPALYLVLPNPLMPETVRLSHLVETAPYQFLFGWFSAWLLANRGRQTAGTAGTAGAARIHEPDAH